MEIVNWIEHEHRFNDLVGWFILHAITKVDGTIDKFKGNEQIEFRSDALQVEFKVNGVELPFVETIHDIEKQMELMVYEKAKEIIDEKFGDLHDGLGEISSAIDDIITLAKEKILEKCGLKY